MPDELRLALAFGLGLSATFALTPLVIRLARRIGFLDHPGGYKQHGGATPYLGGLAVTVGAATAAAVAGPGTGDLAPILLCGLALLAIGTFDDRVGLAIGPRLAVTIGCAAVFSASGLGIEPFSGGAANFAVTVALVVGVVNAYNLMDNLDGACATVGGVSALAIGVVAATEGSIALAAIGFGLAGACIGFLHFNLARPSARIFLGDGGSMAIGGVVAALIMNVPEPGGFEWGVLAVALLMVGLPALDTALVIVSRRRRGVSALSGARDHLTHRLLSRLGSARRVAVVLAAAQVGLIGCAATVGGIDEGLALLVSAAVVAAALGLVAALEMPRPEPQVRVENSPV